MTSVATVNIDCAEAVFDSVGPAYESAFAGLESQAASLEWLKTRLTSKKPAKCLDIGCGTGRPVCSELAAAGYDVTGIDISGVMIEDAREKVPDAKFEKMNVKDFNAAPGSFDAITVYFSMIAGFTQNQICECIQRIYTWLKSDGVFVFATVPVAGNNLEIRWMGRQVVVSSLGRDEAVARIKEVGFQVEYSAVSTFTPKAAQAGICEESDVWEESHLFVYATKQ